MKTFGRKRMNVDQAEVGKGGSELEGERMAGTWVIVKVLSLRYKDFEFTFNLQCAKTAKHKSLSLERTTGVRNCGF